jgi:hypothetical protein
MFCFYLLRIIPPQSDLLTPSQGEERGNPINNPRTRPGERYKLLALPKANILISLLSLFLIDTL